jgi:hypothetical protein
MCLGNDDDDDKREKANSIGHALAWIMTDNDRRPGETLYKKQKNMNITNLRDVKINRGLASYPHAVKRTYAMHT